VIGLPNPYVLIGGGVAALAIAGSIYVQSTMIHGWHVKYDNDEVMIGQLHQQIKNMTDEQNKQTSKSEQTVIKVVQGPREVQSIIKEIEAAPAKPCTAPTYPDEVKNAF
jgi:hypothetical protein